MCQWKCRDELVVFITHACNLKDQHPDCDQRIAHSNYSMDLDSFEKVLSVCQDREWTKFEFFGGEPFLNRLFGTFVTRARETLNVRELAVTTNASFHSRVSDDVLSILDHVYITHYPGINDKEVLEIETRLRTLDVNWTVTRNELESCDAAGSDYGLNEVEIFKLAKECRRRSPSIYADKIFPCCIGEAIQRTNPDIEPSWISLSLDWYEQIHRPYYPICGRCWYILELLGLPTCKPSNPLTSIEM